MFTDPISDFLTRIRNASHAHREHLTTRNSNMIKSIAEVLVNKQFIEKYEEIQEEGKILPSLKIYLRTDREPLELRRMSKPGQRIYVGYKEVKRIRNGLGVGIISTSQGVVCDADARAKKLGGEYICEVY